MYPTQTRLPPPPADRRVSDARTNSVRNSPRRGWKRTGRPRASCGASSWRSCGGWRASFGYESRSRRRQTSSGRSWPAWKGSRPTSGRQKGTEQHVHRTWYTRKGGRRKKVHTSAIFRMVHTSTIVRMVHTRTISGLVHTSVMVGKVHISVVWKMNTGLVVGNGTHKRDCRKRYTQSVIVGKGTH